MADWTSPKTWASSELLTSGDLNTYVRDNTDYLYQAPQATVRLTSAQSVAGSSDQTVLWDEAAWDRDGDMWDVGSPGVVVIRRAGVYHINISMLWDSTVAGDFSARKVFLEKNGASRLSGNSTINAQPAEHQLDLLTNLAVDDYLEVVARQTYESAVSLQPTRTRMTVMWVSSAPA